MHPGSFSATSESSTAVGCSPLRMGADSKNVERRYVFLIRPGYDAVIASDESHTRFRRI